ncbi:MAG: hypothetical protein IT558_05735 [Alphaproteobacteria bacterium]|nr:hypothetical protein [Alphaproteobacteria bacterium]
MKISKKFLEKSYAGTIVVLRHQISGLHAKPAFSRACAPRRRGLERRVLEYKQKLNALCFYNDAMPSPHYTC